MKIVSQVILPQKDASLFQSLQNTELSSYSQETETVISKTEQQNLRSWRMKLRDRPNLAFVNWTQPRVTWEVGTTTEGTF